MSRPRKRKTFAELPVGSIFQSRDGRCTESFTWVALVKVSDTHYARMIASPITWKCGAEGENVITKDLQLDQTQYDPRFQRPS